MERYNTPFKSVLELIGNTPLVQLDCFDTNGCELFVKMENQNPSGSIKDRIGLSMIEEAEKQGKLKPGSVIVEASAGNTGLGLALAGKLKGYHVIIVIPDKMSLEKIAMVKAFGAEVQLARSDVEKGHPEYYQEHAARVASELPNAFYVNQFENEANILAHETTTAPEIWEQMGHKVDAVVCGVGSGGTISGISRYFEKVSPDTDIVLADPEGSILANYVKTGEFSEPGSWLVEGMGEDFIPDVCDLSRVKHAYYVSDRESFLMSRELLMKAGILAGTSAGALVAAALKYCQEQSTPKRVATFICDSGSRYISKVFNDFWMIDQNLLDREEKGDIRDLIGRRYADNAVVTVGPTDTLATTYKRMKMYEVSQLPVMKDDKVIGMIDEEDMLLSIYNNREGFQDPVEKHMITTLKTLPPDSSLEEVMKLVKDGYVPIIADEKRFYGLITKTDILSYLRLHPMTDT